MRVRDEQRGTNEFKEQFDDSDEDKERFPFRQLLPEISTEDAETVRMFARVEAKKIEIANGPNGRPLWWKGRGRGKNDRPSPNESDEEYERYYTNANMWQQLRLRRIKQFHHDKSEWWFKTLKGQDTHKQILLREGAESNPNAAPEDRGFQVGPGPPMQQHGEVAEGVPHSLRNRIVCNPSCVGECANCNEPYGDKVGNARKQCVVCSNQMCMTCQNDVDVGPKPSVHAM